MSRAIALSAMNIEKADGGPFGAVIVKDGKIIGEGWNHVVSHSDPTAHAEVTAIRNASQLIGDFNLDGCIMYTSAEPCPMCMAAIWWSRIKEFYYANTVADAKSIGFDDEDMYIEFAKSPEQRKLPGHHMPEFHDEARQVFKDYAEKEDKIMY